MPTSIQTPYSPMEMFAAGDGPPVRVFGSPQRYVQGPGVLGRLGHYLSAFGFHRAGLLASPRALAAEGVLLEQSLGRAGIECLSLPFGGECSVPEIERQAAIARQAAGGLDVLIALGGGKTVDAGKCLASRLNVPSVIAPSLASNDAPCSALSVIYTDEGVSAGVEFFPESPLMIVVDTEIIASAAARYLSAGIGDAMATWYEARTCSACATGINALGGRPTLAAQAIGEQCARTLYDFGVPALEAVAGQTVDDALERIVEANTLMSGLGFESGGLALAHGMAQAFTVVPALHDNCLHGEMVAMGLLVQLVMQEDRTEATRVAEFFQRVNLPINFDQLGLDLHDADAVRAVVGDALSFPFLGNMGMPITAEQLQQAMTGAHELGRAVAAT